MTRAVVDPDGSDDAPNAGPERQRPGSLDRSTRRYRQLLMGAGCVGLLLISLQVLPLEPPGEHIITYRGASDPALDPVLISAGLVGLAAILGLLWSSRRLPVPLLLTLLCIVTGGLNLSLHKPVELGVAWRLFATGSLDPFLEEGSRVHSLSEYRETYRRLMTAGPAGERLNRQRLPSYPPGLVLLHAGLWRAAESSPSYAATMSRLGEICLSSWRTLGRPFPSDRVRITVIASAAGLRVLAIALVPLGAYLLALRFGTAEQALMAAVLVTLLPSLHLFSSDVTALIVPWPALLVGLAVSHGPPAPAWRLVVAGMLTTAGLFFSASYVASIALLVLVVVTLGVRSGIPHALRDVAWVGLGSSLAIATAAAAGFDLLSLTALSTHNNQLFYGLIGRTYPPSVIFNPLELAATAGLLPVAALALGAWESARRLLRGEAVAADALIVSVLVVTLVVLFSGSVRGEVGRLTLPLMPAMMAAACVDPRMDRLTVRAVALLMAAQLLLACAFIEPVTGFWTGPNVTPTQ